MGSIGFPVTIICTLQGTSVTQGNPAIFTGNKFAVSFRLLGRILGRIFMFKRRVMDLNWHE